MNNRKIFSVGSTVIAVVFFSIAFGASGLHAGTDTRRLTAPKGLGGPPSSDIGLLKIQEGLQTVVDSINNLEERMEKISGALTAQQAQSDQLNMRLAEAMARDARAGALQTANLAVGMANEATKVAAAYELAGATGWSNADTGANRLWNQQVSSMGEGILPPGEDKTKEQIMERVVAAGCEAGAMNRSEAKRAGCQSRLVAREPTLCWQRSDALVLALEMCFQRVTCCAIQLEQS